MPEDPTPPIFNLLASGVGVRGNANFRFGVRGNANFSTSSFASQWNIGFRLENKVNCQEIIEIH